MYEYLAGTGIGALVWTGLFLVRKDLRRPMVWSGSFYVVLLSIGFAAYRVTVNDPARSITPGYWAPPTLFNLGRLTGGYAIEDVLFMFFAAGIAAALYELLFRRAIATRPPAQKLKKRHALWVGLVGAMVVFSVFRVNAIYLLIAFNFFGALALMWQRRDLVSQSLIGGLLFLAAYSCMFLAFNRLFPEFIPRYYHLELTSHIMIWGVPLEEYLYGFTFGLLWTPLYEYEHRYKNDELKTAHPKA